MQQLKGGIMKYKEKWLEANLKIMEDWNRIHDLEMMITEKLPKDFLTSKQLNLLKETREYLKKPLYK